jgi:hypothetical protein
MRVVVRWLALGLALVGCAEVTRGTSLYASSLALSLRER